MNQLSLIPDQLGDFLRVLPRIESIIAVMDYFDDDPPELLGPASDVHTREVRYVSEIPEFFIDRPADGYRKNCATCKPSWMSCLDCPVAIARYESGEGNA